MPLWYPSKTRAPGGSQLTLVCFFVMMFVFFFLILSVVMPCKFVFLYFICHCYIFGAGWVSKAIYDVILTGSPEVYYFKND